MVQITIRRQRTGIVKIRRKCMYVGKYIKLSNVTYIIAILDYK